MARFADSRIWFQRGVFLALAFVLIVADLLPLDMRPSLWVAPDLLLLCTIAWVVRGPSYAPVFAVALVMLMADFLFMRPPGLWAALVVMLTEILRRNHREFRNMPLLVEWGTVTIGIVAITIINRITLAIVMAPQAPVVLTAIEMAVTVLAYPLVLVIARYAFGVARSAPGEVGKQGQRL